MFPYTDRNLFFFFKALVFCSRLLDQYVLPVVVYVYVIKLLELHKVTTEPLLY